MGSAKAMKVALEGPSGPERGKTPSQDHAAASSGPEFSVTG